MFRDTPSSYRDNLYFVRDRWEIFLHLMGAGPRPLLVLPNPHPMGRAPGRRRGWAWVAALGVWAVPVRRGA